MPAKEKTGDLTSSQYWGQRQAGLPPPRLSRVEEELIDSIIPHLREYEKRRFLEIGCSPGIISSFLCRRIDIVPHGIDFSPEADKFLQNIRLIAGVSGTLYQCDVREYRGEADFDVVASFGLVEHFVDPSDIMFHHHRLCRPKGLIVMTIPNFRYAQWLYHAVFDRVDLSRHNLKMMQLDTFREYAEKMGHEVLFLGYVGTVCFWGIQTSGSRISVLLRKIGAFAVWQLTNRILAYVIPPNIRYFAPWIVYVARRGS